MLTAVHCAAESVGGMCEASCHLSNSGAQRWERWCSADTSLILFYLCVEILAHGIVLPTFRVCRPSSVKPLWKHLHRNARALSPRWFQIQLTMKINHHNELSQPWLWTPANLRALETTCKCDVHEIPELHSVLNSALHTYKICCF